MTPLQGLAKDFVLVPSVPRVLILDDGFVGEHGGDDIGDWEIVVGPPS